MTTRPITATMAGLVHLFGMSESTLRRAFVAHGIKGSDRFGPVVYPVDSVEKALFPVEGSETPAAGSGQDPGVQAVRQFHAKSKAG